MREGCACSKHCLPAQAGGCVPEPAPRSDWAVLQRLLCFRWQLRLDIYSDLGTVCNSFWYRLTHCCTFLASERYRSSIHRIHHISTSQTITLLPKYTYTTEQPTLTTPRTLIIMAPSDNNKMWKKRYLIPLWVVQLIVLGIYFVLSIVGMSAAEDLDDYLDSPEWNNRSDYADQVVYVSSLAPPRQ